MPNNLLEDYPLKQISFPVEHANGVRYPSIFLAGRSGWQDELASLLADENVFLLTPSPFNPTNDLAKLIDWERRQRFRADAIMFWFPSDFPAHIISKAFVKNKKVFMGVHPQCKYRANVDVLARRLNPPLVIADSIASLANQVRDWLKTYEHRNHACESHKS